jgi:hypothetical protein
MRFCFTIRDLLWLTAVVALAMPIGLWVPRVRQQAAFEAEIYRPKGEQLLRLERASVISVRH